MSHSNRGKYPQARYLEIVLWIVGAAILLALLMPFAADRIGVIHGRREALDTVAEKACAESSQDRCQVAVAMRAAYAADDVVDLAIWQFFAGIVGIGFVGLTLKATRDAVKEANAATETAGKALLITERSAELQLRPYVYIEEWSFDWTCSIEDTALPIEQRKLIGWEFRYNWKNMGQTPANSVTAMVTPIVFVGNVADDFDFPEHRLSPTGSLGPGQTFHSRMFLDADVLTSAWRGEKAIHVYMSCEYDDGFVGTPRHRTERHTRLNVTVDPRTKDGRFSDSFVDRFNGADADCHRQPERNKI
jgi:hypothetical protein